MNVDTGVLLNNEALGKSWTGGNVQDVIGEIFSGAVDTVSGLFAYGREKVEWVEQLYSTVSSEIDVTTNSDISGLNRDLSKQREVLVDKKTKYSFAIPIISPKELMRSTERIANMLGDIHSRMKDRFAQAKMEAQTGSERERIEEIETAYEEQKNVIESMMLAEDEKAFVGQALEESIMAELAESVSEYRKQSGDEGKMEWFDEFRKGQISTNTQFDAWESVAEDASGLNIRVVHVRKQGMEMHLNAAPELMTDNEGGFNVRGVSYDQVTQKITFRALRENEFLSIETDLASLMKLRSAQYMIVASDGVQDVVQYWNESPNIRLTASLALDFLPVVGNAKAISELMAGRDYVHDIGDYDGWDYTFTVVGAVIPGGKHLGKAAKKLIRVATTAEMLEGIKDLEKIAKSLDPRDLELLDLTMNAAQKGIPFDQLSRAQKGVVGEIRAMQNLVEKGYEPLAAKYDKTHGLDTVAIKWKNGIKHMDEIIENPSKLLDYASDIEEIAIVEAKYNKDGRLMRGMTKQGEQLDPEKIRRDIEKMIRSEKDLAKMLGKLLDQNKDLRKNAIRYYQVLNAENTVKMIHPEL